MTAAAPAQRRWLAAPRPLTGLRSVFALWSVFTALMLIFMPLFGNGPVDADDFLRIMQVRDLLGGQDWFDVRQYRINPPEGADMHWSRLADLPVAAAIVAFGLVLPPLQAEFAAVVLVPLLYLLTAMVLLWQIMRRLDMPEPARLLALLAMPLFPLLPFNFMPWRIDHHTPQALCALACLFLLLNAPSRRAALAAGAVAAIWLVISLEGLVQVAIFAAIYGLRYAMVRDRSLAWFLLSLSIGATILSLATRSLAELGAPYCDILRWGHFGAFGAAAGISFLLPRLPAQGSWQGRMMALGLLPAASLPIVLSTIGRCAIDPFGGLPPVVRAYWFNYVLEGLPVWQLLPSQGVMVIWTVLLVPAGWLVLRRRRLASDDWQDRWKYYALAALLMGLFSLLLMRASLIAQLFTVPLAGILLWHFLPIARNMQATLPRVLATVGCFTLTTPALATAFASPLDKSLIADPRMREALGYLENGDCDTRILAELPDTKLFATIDVTPEIIMNTGHTAIASGHHRNADRMAEVIEAYSGDLQQAERIVRKSGAQYLLFCTAKLDVAMYRARRADNLVNHLAADDPPAWLKPMPAYDGGPLRVYEVR